MYAYYSFHSIARTVPDHTNSGTLWENRRGPKHRDHDKRWVVHTWQLSKTMWLDYDKLGERVIAGLLCTL